MERYELIVIGSGPAGEKAAAKAAYFNHKVALVEKSKSFGGTANEEAIPAKVLKELALHIAGKLQVKLYGKIEQTKHMFPVDSVLERARRLSLDQSNNVKENLNNHGIALYHGTASFQDPHTILITGDERKEIIYGERIVIATGTSPIYFGDTTIINGKERLSTSSHLIVDGKRIHNTKTIYQIPRLPKSLCIVGMGVSGCEYASVFSSMGVKVIMLNRSPKVLPFIDSTILDFFLKEVREEGVKLKLQEEFETIEIPENDRDLLTITLKSGEVFPIDMILYASGREGNISDLKLENAGVKVLDRGNIQVNEYYRTDVPHIYAVGDVVGKGQLANLAMDQGRIAIADMFQMSDLKELGRSPPLGLYTIPEIGAVGMTEEQVKENRINYCVGTARYSDVSRGAFVEGSGMIRFIFERESKVILGVHIVGPLATELIHYGIDLVRNKRTLLHVIAESFNFPSLHEIYKYAAYDGLSSLTGYKLRK